MPIQTGPESRRALPIAKGQVPTPPELVPMDAIKWSFDWCRSDITRVVLPVVVHETMILSASLVVPRMLGSILRGTPETAPRAGTLTVPAAVEYLSGTLLGLVAMAYAASALYPYLLNIARGRPVGFSEAFRSGPDFSSALKLVCHHAGSCAVTARACRRKWPGFLQRTEIGLHLRRRKRRESTVLWIAHYPRCRSRRHRLSGHDR